MTDADALKEKAALASITASALLTLGKLAAGLFSGSLALLSEAGHGLLDTGATILTYFAIRASGKPADEEHHYGHGKVEAVAALAETGLLIVLSIYVLIEAVRRLVGHQADPIEATWPVFAVLVVSIVVDLVRWRSLSAIADGITARAVRLRAVEGGCRVLGEMEIGGTLECERDLLHLLTDGDLRLAENHEKMLRLVAECADALDGVAVAAAAAGALTREAVLQE